MGHGRFLVFYLLAVRARRARAGLGRPRDADAVVGASGAIAGVMGAYFVLFPHSRVLVLVVPGDLSSTSSRSRPCSSWACGSCSQVAERPRAHADAAPWAASRSGRTSAGSSPASPRVWVFRRRERLRVRRGGAADSASARLRGARRARRAPSSMISFSNSRSNSAAGIIVRRRRRSSTCSVSACWRTSSFCTSGSDDLRHARPRRGRSTPRRRRPAPVAVATPPLAVAGVVEHRRFGGHVPVCS